MKRRRFILASLLAVLWPWKRAEAIDIWGPIIEPTGQQVLCPQMKITFKVLKSEVNPMTKDRDVIDDCTTADKSILFPDVISKLTKDEKERLKNVLAEFFTQLARERLEQ